MKPTKKELLYTFQYRVDVTDATNIEEILEKMRETGSAEITDVSIIEEKK